MMKRLNKFLFIFNFVSLVITCQAFTACGSGDEDTDNADLTTPSSITPQNHDYTIGEDNIPEGVSTSAPTGSLNISELKLVGTWTVAGTNSSKAPSPIVLGSNRSFTASEGTATATGTWGADAGAIYLYYTYNQERHLRIITYTIVDSKTVDFYKTRYVTQDGNTGEEGNSSTSSENLLSGRFSVSATKQVLFTKSNVYWDGNAFKFETNQTDYQTSWNANHVSHFYWTKTVSNSYAQSYNDGTNSKGDVPFFAESKGGLTVEGTSGLFALTQTEWMYLTQYRTNALSLCKSGVMVKYSGNNYVKCLVIAPDNFSGKLSSTYTLEQAKNLSLVCLPSAGYRSGSIFHSSFFNDERNDGYYLSSSTPNNTGSNYASTMEFDDKSWGECDCTRNNGCSLRLVALP